MLAGVFDGRINPLMHQVAYPTYTKNLPRYTIEGGGQY